MRFSFYASVLLIAAAQLTGLPALAQQLAFAPEQHDCGPEEPASLQISWNKPCEEGDWLLDTQAGCRMWDWHPDQHDRAAWSGACSGDLKVGKGIVQWTEHAQLIDRFDGTFRNGKREGFGRYVWNKDTSFEGQYANDVPNGPGRATIVGEVFSGDWQNGCFRKGDRVIAIGVSRSSCGYSNAGIHPDGPAGS